MSEQQNVKSVQEAYAAFGQGDIPTALSYLSNDIVWEVPGPDVLPWAGVHKGQEAVTSFFQTLGANAGTEHFQPEEFIAQGEMVVVLGHEKGTSPSTGRKYTNRWAHIFTMRNGKVSRFREYQDTFAMAEAFRQ